MVDKEIVNSKLLKLEEYIHDLQEYSEISLDRYREDKVIQRYLERTLHLAIESILDIGSHIISDERLGSPDSNSDIIKILAKHDIIKDNVDNYIMMAQFRNIIVHDYAEIDPEIIVTIINDGIKDLKEIFKWYIKYIS